MLEEFQQDVLKVVLNSGGKVDDVCEELRDNGMYILCVVVLGEIFEVGMYWFYYYVMD